MGRAGSSTPARAHRPQPCSQPANLSRPDLATGRRRATLTRASGVTWRPCRRGQDLPSILTAASPEVRTSMATYKFCNGPRHATRRQAPGPVDDPCLRRQARRRVDHGHDGEAKGQPLGHGEPRREGTARHHQDVNVSAVLMTRSAPCGHAAHPASAYAANAAAYVTAGTT